VRHAAFSLCLAAMTVVLALCTGLYPGTLALVGARADAAATTLASPPPRLLRGQTPMVVSRGAAVRRGPHAPDSALTLTIGLGVRNAAALDAVIAAASDPASPWYGHYLTRDEYRARFAPTDADVSTVRTWAERAGLRVDVVSPERLLVTARGTTSQVQRLLGVTIDDYSLPDRRFYSNDRDPAVPSDLNVVAISGLTSLSRIQAMHVAPTRPANVPAGGYRPQDFQTAYNTVPVGDAAGQTIGFTLWGAPLAQSDLDGFARNTGTATVTVGGVGANGVEFIPVNGNDEQHTAGDLQMEIALDVETAHGMAPNNHLKYWLGDVVPGTADVPTDTGLEIAVDDAANDPSVHIVSNSWSGQDAAEEDPGFVPTIDPILQYAASVGTTFYFSSGDGGYTSGAICYNYNQSPCTTSATAYPAESPYVVAVGGTSLTTNGDGSYGGESAWNGSGGGCSTYYGRPVWQVGLTGTAALCTDTSGQPGRTIPDIAADGNPGTGAYIYLNGGGKTVGGASVGAPLWAGMTADMNNYLLGRGQCPVGFAAPRLYQLATGSTYARDFHDVTSGNNDPPGGDPAQAYTAGPGYDDVTGWGSPNLGNLAADWPVTGAGNSACSTTGDRSGAPTPVPGFTAAPTPTPTFSPTHTATPSPTTGSTTTATPSPTGTAMATSSSTNPATATSSPTTDPVTTATSIATGATTPLASASAAPGIPTPTTTVVAPMSTVTGTEVPSPSPTGAATATATPTATPTMLTSPVSSPTATMSAPVSATPTSTTTPLPSATATTTTTPTATNTPTATATETPSSTCTSTPTATSIPSATPTASATPTTGATPTVSTVVPTTIATGDDPSMATAVSTSPSGRPVSSVTPRETAPPTVVPPRPTMTATATSVPRLHTTVRHGKTVKVTSPPLDLSVTVARAGTTGARTVTIGVRTARRTAVTLTLTLTAMQPHVVSLPAQSTRAARHASHVVSKTTRPQRHTPQGLQKIGLGARCARCASRPSPRWTRDGRDARAPRKAPSRFATPIFCKPCHTPAVHGGAHSRPAQASRPVTLTLYRRTLHIHTDGAGRAHSQVFFRFAHLPRGIAQITLSVTARTTCCATTRTARISLLPAPGARPQPHHNSRRLTKQLLWFLNRSL